MMSGCYTDHQAADPALVERRQKNRFDVHTNLRYRMIERKNVISGAGKTLNVSSSGMLFTTEHELPVGRTIKIEIEWPALLDGTCLLKLVGTATVVRSLERHAAIRILRYEFRTRRATA